MRFLAVILVAAATFVSSPLDARAGIDLNIVNRTDHEIVYMSAQMSDGSIALSPDIMPGGNFVLTQDSKITKLQFDSGVLSFVFDNVNIDKSVTLQLAYENNVAVLAAEGKAPGECLDALRGQTAGTGGTDKGKEAKGESFDLEAGPIWDNDHARELCPALVAQWMKENPGREAEWTGAWATTVEGEMSVCNVRVKAQASAAPAASAPKAPEGMYAGTVVSLVKPDAQATMEALLAVRNVDEAKALGAVPSHRGERTLLLPVSFGGTGWAAFIHTDSDGAVTAAQLYATNEEETEISSSLKALSAMGYRPWYTEVREGPDMKLKGATRYWNNAKLADRAFVEDLLSRACNEVYESDSPLSAETFFLPAAAWEKAEGGEDVVAPCMRLRVTPAENLILTYHRDGSTIVALTRGE